MKTFMLIFLCAVIAAKAKVFTENNDQKVIVVRGNYHQMGVEYGKDSKEDLESVFNILEFFFVQQNRVSLSKMAEAADRFYQKFPYSFQQMMEGISIGSGLSLSTIKILNAQETLFHLIESNIAVGQCTFAKITDYVLRNYDYPKPFDKISKFTTVTILHAIGSLPVAIVHFPGQIYCSTCMNSAGLFLELNNGMPSGGFESFNDRRTILALLLDVLQNSKTYEQAKCSLRSINSDYSLIVNLASRLNCSSFEYSTDAKA
jgi:hypothetical protein